MKKLLTIVAIAMVAISANAAAYTWSANSGRLFNGQGSTTANRYAGTGYLFDVDTISQSDILIAFASTDGVTDELRGALSTGTFASGLAGISDEFTGPNANFIAYFVVFGKDASGNDAIYISDTITAEYSAVGQGAIEFGQQNDYSSVGFKDAAGGFTTAGWYSSASAVPEPTSGLLLLLGVAGLALKRKQA